MSGEIMFDFDELCVLCKYRHDPFDIGEKYYCKIMEKMSETIVGRIDNSCREVECPRIKRN